MLYIKRGEQNDMVVTVSQHKELSTNYFLFSFEHILSKEKVRFYPQNISTYTDRFDEFRFVESENENLTLTPPYVTFPFEGDYYYSVYQMSSSATTNPAFAYAKLEEGRAYVSGDTTSGFYTQFISDNDENDNYIFLSDAEQRPISLDYCTGLTFTSSISAYTDTYDLAYSGTEPLLGYTSGASSPFQFICGTEPNSGKNFVIFTGNTNGVTMVYNQDALQYQLLRNVSLTGCNQSYSYTSRIVLASTSTFEYNDYYWPWGSYSTGAIVYDNCSAVPTPTPTPTPTNTPTITPTNLPSCPQRIVISASSNEALVPNGNWDLLNLTTGSTTTQYGYSTSSPTNVYLETAPDFYDYAIYGFVSGITYFQFVYNITNSTWDILRSNYDWIPEGGTYTGGLSNGNSAVNYDGTIGYPIKGTYGNLFLGQYTLSYPEDCPTPTQTPTQTVTPTASCPVTTQYLGSELVDGDKIRLTLWEDAGLSIQDEAVCDYEVSGQFTGTLGTIYTGTRTFPTGDHQIQYNFTPLLQSGETISSYVVSSVVTSACTCPVVVNIIQQTPTPTASPQPTPTPTPTGTPQPTPTPTVTITPSSSPSAFDADAAAYLERVVLTGGTVTEAMSAATNTLFTSLKSNNLWDKLEVFYPVIGGTLLACGIEGKGRDTFDITFNNCTVDVSGVTHSAVQSAYGDTHFTPSTDATGMTQNNVHLSIYNGQTGEGDGYAGTINNFSTNKQYLLLNYNLGGGNYAQWPSANDNAGSYDTTVGVIDTAGMWISDRNNDASNIEMYQNGSQYNTYSVTSSSGLPPTKLHMPGVSQSGGSNWGTAGGRLQWGSIGQGLGSGDASTLSSIVNTFQTALGRNTY